MYMFADDATLFVSGHSVESVETQLNLAMSEIHLWTIENKLILNAKKTKVMLLGSRQRLNTLQDKDLKVKINDTELECVTHSKCLGVIIDNNLNFKQHVDSVAKTMKQKLGMIRRTKHLFTRNQLSRIYWGLVLPHALYCSSVWSSRSETNFKTVNKLHKRASYIVSGCTWETPSEQVLQLLGWRPLNVLFNKSIACMMYKCVNGIAPPILSNRICFNDDVSLRTTRNSNRNLLRLPLCKTQFYQKTFAYKGAQVWNSLNDECRRSNSLYSFKNALKRNNNLN